MITKQMRGCSKLYYALATVGEDGTLTFGQPKHLAIVKSISRSVENPSEQVFGDNGLVDEVFGATTATRSFEVVGVGADVEAELLGHTVLNAGDEETPHISSTSPDGSSKPFVAIGYALHDGKVDDPKELVWLFQCKVNSISKTSATIDSGTGSEGQTIEITAYTPRKKWTKTNKRELDICASKVGNETLLTNWYDGAWFAQVITPDNYETNLLG